LELSGEAEKCGFIAEAAEEVHADGEVVSGPVQGHGHGGVAGEGGGPARGGGRPAPSPQPPGPPPVPRRPSPRSRSPRRNRGGRGTGRLGARTAAVLRSIGGRPRLGPACRSPSRRG